MGRGSVPFGEQRYDLINADKEGLHQMSRHWGPTLALSPPNSHTTSNRHWVGGWEHLRQTEGNSSQPGVVSLRDRHVQ